MSEQLKQTNFPRMTQTKGSLVYPFCDIKSKMSNVSISGALTECVTPVNSNIQTHDDFLLLKLRALDEHLMPDECESMISDVNESNEESGFLYYPPNSPDLTFKKAKTNISNLILE